MNHRLASAALFLGLSGCTWLLDYPAVGEESGLLCQNRIDDDLDGRLDCDDADDCAETPACAEVGFVACNDGRDNDRDGAFDCADDGCGGCAERRADECFDEIDQDGDGLVDDDDPGCWPTRPPVVSRCASLAPAHALSIFGRVAAGVEGFPFWGTPDLYVEAYAGGLYLWPYSDDYLGVVGSLDTVPLRDSVRYEVDLLTEEYDAERVWIALVPERLAPVNARPLPEAASAEIALEIDYVGSELIARAGGREQRRPFDRVGTLRLAIELRAGVLTASVQEGLSATARRTYLPPIDAPTDLGAVRLVVGMMGGVTVYEVRYQAAGVDPCGHPVPEIPGEDDRAFGDETSLLDTGLSVAVAQADASYCALTVSCERAGLEVVRTVTAWASDDGVTWEERIPPLTPNGVDDIGGVGIAWDAEARAFRAAVARRPATGGAAEVLVVTGFSCGDWDVPVASGLPRLMLDGAAGCAGGAGTSLSYVVSPPVGDAPGRHEIWVAGPLGEGGASGLARAVSPDGRSFTLDRLPDGRDPVPGPVAVTRLGGDRVRMRPAAPGSLVPGVVLEVARDAFGSAWDAVGSTSPGILPASGLLQTFDGDAPISGVVVPGLPNLAEYLVVYGARGDFRGRRSTGVGYASVGTARLDTAVTAARGD